MPSRRRSRCLFATLPWLIISALLVAPVRAVDDEQAFIDALRERGDHDLALEYLEGAAKRRLTSDAFRKRLAYELAVTRLDNARTIRDAARRTAALEAAAGDVQKFSAESSNKRLAAEAESRLGGAFTSAGKIDLARAKPLRNGASKNEAAPILASARIAFDNARRHYAAAEKLYETILADYKTAEPDTPAARQRLELRGLLAQTRLLNKRALQDKAAAYKSGSKSYKDLHKQAGEELAAFYEKYSRFLVGLYAHLYEGQSYLALKRYKLAVGCFEDLVQQPDDDPNFRRLITLAHASLAEARIAQGELEPALDEGLKRLESLRRDEEQETEALALTYQVARASMLQAETLSGGDRRRMLSDARQWFRTAARVSHPQQADARDALDRVNDLLGVADAALESFKDAYQAVRDALNSLNASRQAIRIAERNNPSVVEELQAEASDSRRRARVAAEAAIKLIDDETPLSEVNEVRSQLAFLLWEGGEYLRAAVVGEFLATRHPDDPAAEQAANLAVASLQRAYQASRGEGSDGRFESARLSALTAWIIKTWPNTKTASAASGVLVSLALRDGKVDDARRVIGTVDEVNRPALELQLATAVWEQANRRLAEVDDAARPAAEREKAKAAESLAQAYENSRSQRPVSAQLATAGLYLAQARLESGQAKQAIAILEAKDVGPLPLLSQSAPAVSRSGFAAEAYKLALRAYVSLDPPRTDDALATMKRLESAIRANGGDAATQRAKLTRTYFALGVQLQRQIESLTARNKTKQARQLSGAFAVFLTSLSKQAVDADWTTRQWIGQTYLQLADGLGDDPQAKQYRGKARDVFHGLIERAEQDPNYAPKENSVLAARLQLGRAQRELGEYESAFSVFREILAGRQALLEVQKEAAYTLQEWGTASDISKLDDAVRGTQLDPQTKKNVVWGWSKLSRVAANAARRQPKYKDLFFESWLNIVACRYLHAKQVAPGAERDKLLASTRRTLSSLVRQYADLGGAERRRDFDRLAKQIQKLDDSEPIGLQEFENKKS